MKHVVITGSTRGIGLGLAREFLKLGCSVTISGRAQENIDQVISELHSDYASDHVFGFACDVRDPDEVQALWDASLDKYGKIDIWINNAGYSGPQIPAWEIEPDNAKEIIETNLLGVINGSIVAVREMIAQGYGALYNMEGMGSDGRIHSGLTYYGTSNSGRHYFNQSLIKETEDTPLIIGTLRPGMVVTDMLTDQYAHRPDDWERDKRIFNILADRVETVTPWMAARILENQKSGIKINWSSRWKILLRFITAPITKRDIFKEPADNPGI
jgi:NAD(P)-dependent dehydrogenase (short-subunit alcohol dehydrogenase family)